MSLPTPDFFERDPAKVVAEMVSYFELESGKTLYPAQPERLQVNNFAYRESVLREAGQDASMQNLVAFARAPMLDYLGQLLGVVRLGESHASTILRFEFPAPYGAPVYIPEGVRVATADGLIVFATNQIGKLVLGDTIVDIPATCETAGVVGNGWEPGQASTLLDDIGVVGVVVTNHAVSAGGSEPEIDDHLRQRIMLAPDAFSTAGSRLAYRYHALSASPLITDVAVTLQIPGTVALYVMTGTDVPSSGILDQVDAACSAEKVRPLCDTVNVISRLTQNYSINVGLTVLEGVVDADVIALVVVALEQYVADRASGLGKDVVTDRIKAVCLAVDGVVKANVVAPVADLVIEETTLAINTGINVTVSGYMHG